MYTDIEIIKKNKMKQIMDVIEKYDINPDEVFRYGKYIGKIDLDIFKRLKDKKEGKLILVTAITPTPYGEGKSTTTIGLVDGMNEIGKKCVGAIREPSLGPVFGIKGGAAGGGYAQVNPMVELNLHFTGDIHAITTANNLVSACIDNTLYFDNHLNIDPNNITWKRCIDLNDRALRKVTVGLSSKKEVTREDSFNISVASDIMAILCLATSFKDLRKRLDRSVVGYRFDGTPVTIKDLNITGSLMVLLKDAMKPNVMQTLENNLMFVHGGPFANIAHGCNSVLATRLALKVSDYVVTEAGFGADLGAEKFLDIKSRVASLNPNAVVIVATIKALKHHGGVLKDDLKKENLDALRKGLVNLEKHIETIKTFNIPCIIAINKFDFDTEKEIKVLEEFGKKMNVSISLSEVHGKGGKGAIDLSQKLVKLIDDNPNPKLKYLYQMNDSVKTKIKKIAQKAYGAKNVVYSEIAEDKINNLEKQGTSDYYICVAKTPASLSDDPKKIGRPTNFDIHVMDIQVATGSRFIIVLTGKVMRMPGLARKPMALKIDMNDEEEVFGLM